MRDSTTDVIWDIVFAVISAIACPFKSCVKDLSALADNEEIPPVTSFLCTLLTTLSIFTALAIYNPLSVHGTPKSIFALLVYEVVALMIMAKSTKPLLSIYLRIANSRNNYMARHKKNE